MLYVGWEGVETAGGGVRGGGLWEGSPDLGLER